MKKSEKRGMKQEKRGERERKRKVTCRHGQEGNKLVHQQMWNLSVVLTKKKI